jgi:uncharacterized protein (TIGR02186 family)
LTGIIGLCAILWGVAIILFPYAVAASTKPIIADLSLHRIEITSGFQGTRLLLFGARNDSGDIVIVVRGPEFDFTVRRKDRVAGMWMNREQVKFTSLPGYYLIAASRPLEFLKNQPLLQELAIGTGNLPFMMLEEIKSSEVDAATLEQFRAAFIKNRKISGLYGLETADVSFMGETLFKTALDFPDNLPRGIYTVEIYLFGDGELRAMQTIPIEVKKSGFDAVIYDLAHQTPGLYGFLAITLAILGGWTASIIFRKK